MKGIAIDNPSERVRGGLGVCDLDRLERIASAGLATGRQPDVGGSSAEAPQDDPSQAPPRLEAETLLQLVEEVREARRLLEDPELRSWRVRLAAQELAFRMLEEML